MKKMKKVFAMLLALAMVLGMSMTAFAEEGQVPAADDETSATVSNVEAGATVTAYRIVEPIYTTNGITGYKAVTGVNLTNPLAPTSTEVTGIAANQTLLANLESKPLTTETTSGMATYSADLTAGYWVVVVTGSKTNEIYNPMLLGVYYSVGGSDNTLTAKPVSADDDWGLASTPAYAKSEQPAIDKKVVNEEGNEITESNVAFGDTVSFQIDTAIPSYSAAYEAVSVEITDSLSIGLTLSGAPVVKVDGVEVTASDDTYSYIPATNNNGFTISFDSDYALANNGKPVVVTYSATVGTTAGFNFNSNTNTATLNYTNDPHNTDSKKPVSDTTYTYTFALGASLYGTSEETWNKTTEEIFKTGETRTYEENGETKTTNRLGGAVFTLTGVDRTDIVKTAASDENGHLQFTGLAAGKYMLKETKAPDGYSLNDTEIPVEIIPTYNSDGTLQSYKVLIKEAESAEYTAEYTSKVVTNITETKPADSALGEILNTKLAELPSTGGIGTTIFTIAGCLIMVVAAGLFFASRRKSAVK